MNVKYEDKIYMWPVPQVNLYVINTMYNVDTRIKSKSTVIVNLLLYKNKLTA